MCQINVYIKWSALRHHVVSIDDCHAVVGAVGREVRIQSRPGALGLILRKYVLYHFNGWPSIKLFTLYMALLPTESVKPPLMRKLLPSLMLLKPLIGPSGRV